MAWFSIGTHVFARFWHPYLNETMLEFNYGHTSCGANNEQASIKMNRNIQEDSNPEQGNRDVDAQPT